MSLNLTKEYLYQEYIIQKKSSVAIAREIGCNPCTIMVHLRKFNIPIKTTSEATKEAMHRPEIQVKLHKPKTAAGLIACKKNFAKGHKRWNELYKGKKLEQIIGIEKAAVIKVAFTKGRMSRKGTHQTAETIAKIRKARFEQVIPNNNTIPEQIVEGILKRNSLNYRKQWNVDYKMLVDFYLPDFNMMIFADGDFWHCHPRFGFTDEQVVHHGKTKKEIVAKDDYHNKHLYQKGYKVLRFWEQDLKNNEAQVEQKIMEEVSNGNKGKSKVVCVEPHTSLYAGITGECLDTGNSDNSKLQSISRQPA